MDTIAIIVPCYNEQEVLEEFHRRTESVLAQVKDCRFRYLFVNDGSRDGTLAVLRQLAAEDRKVSYLSFSRNFGKEAAMLAGLDYAECDAAVIMDADLQHPPEMIPDMICWWRDGCDDVCAKRADRNDEGFVKRHLTNFFINCCRNAAARKFSGMWEISVCSTGGASRRFGSCGKASATRRACSPGWDFGKKKFPSMCSPVRQGRPRGITGRS